MKTFFNLKMNVENNHSFSPSAGKPKKLIDFLYLNDREIHIEQDFSPLTETDLMLAHDQEMVKSILDGTRPNGFGNKLKEVSDSLLYTSGSFYAAALNSVINKENTFSPTSGFHHAGFNSCGGFCTFNGLMIAALKLKNSGLVNKIGIIDCDQHYGDGTQNIIDKLNIDWINHYTFGADYIKPNIADKWLKSFKRKLNKFNDVDIIFYQAGADPHEDDPLGGSLTTEQMTKRDEIVFKHFRNKNIPITWNLAGGYQNPIDKVLLLHENTYKIATRMSK